MSPPIHSTFSSEIEFHLSVVCVLLEIHGVTQGQNRRGNVGEITARTVQMKLRSVI